MLIQVCGVGLDADDNALSEVDKWHAVLLELTTRITGANKLGWALHTPFQENHAEFRLDQSETKMIEVEVFGRKPSGRSYPLGTLIAKKMWNIRSVRFKNGGHLRSDYVRAFRWIGKVVEDFNVEMLISHACLVGCPHEMLDCVSVDPEDKVTWSALADWVEERCQTEKFRSKGINYGLSYSFRRLGSMVIGLNTVRLSDIPNKDGDRDF